MYTSFVLTYIFWHNILNQQKYLRSGFRIKSSYFFNEPEMFSTHLHSPSCYILLIQQKYQNWLSAKIFRRLPLSVLFSIFPVLQPLNKVSDCPTTYCLPDLKSFKLQNNNPAGASWLIPFLNKISPTTWFMSN